MCPTDEQLSALLASGPQEKDAQIEAHLAVCVACAGRVVRLIGLDGTQRTQSVPGGETRRSEAGFAFSRGTQAGRYILLEPLGSGGMGEVYSAYDPELERKIALKFLPLPSGADPHQRLDARLRLSREAKAMAKVSHPNVVQVYDLGAHDEQVFVAMERVEGESLRDWLAARTGPLPVAIILDIFLQAGRGLAAAHQAGLVHRDFKPGNVLIGPDLKVKVGDFGLARYFEESGQSLAPPAEEASRLLSTTVTLHGKTVGTPAYMAPEQWRGQVDARSDQYAFCVSLYEALHGARPTEGKVGRRKLPRHLEAALARGLSPDPAERFATMELALAELARRPRRSAAGWVACAAVVAIGAGVLGAKHLRRERQAQRCTAEAKRAMALGWDGARSALIEQAFRATRSPLAAEQFVRAGVILDRISRDWIATSAAVCLASHDATQPPAALSLEQECLAGQQDALVALSDMFLELDADQVANAVSAARSLEEPRRCLDLPHLEAAARPGAASVASLRPVRRQLVRARAAITAGRYPEALRLVNEGVAQAGSPGLETLLPEALALQGVAFQLSGDFRKSQESLVQGLHRGIEASQDTVVAEAAIALITSCRELGDADQAARWARLAESAVKRLGNPPLQRAHLLMNRLTLTQRSDLAGTRRDALEALKQIRLARSEDHPEVAEYIADVGAVVFNTGDFPAAIKLYQEALALAERSLGPSHPLIGSILNGLVYSYYAQGRLAQALPYAERAFALNGNLRGAEDLTTTLAQLNLGNLLRDLGQPKRAAELHRDLLARVERRFGPAHRRTEDTQLSLAMDLLELKELPESLQLSRQTLTAREMADHDSKRVGIALVPLGRALLADGHPREALGALRRAAAIFARSAKDPSYANTLRHLGYAELASGHVDAAVGTLTRAAALHQAAGDSVTLALARFDLARALWEQGRNQTEASKLAEQAYADFPADWAVLKEEMREWLSQHRGTR